MTTPVPSAPPPRLVFPPARSAARLSAARSILVADQPWFGMLALRLQMESSTQTRTMDVDGSTIRFNPDWVASQPDSALRGAVAHEVAHCALLHPYRFGARDHRRWNEACDIAVNAALRAAGIPLPAGVLDEPEYAGLSAESIYAKRRRPDEESGGGGGGSGGDSGGDQTTVSPAPRPAAPDPNGQPAAPSAGQPATPPPGMTAAGWQVAAEQAAMVCRKAGTMPGGVDRAVTATRAPRVDWKEALRRFVQHVQPSDYSWSPPNRRFVAQGLYLPGVRRENLPPLGVGIDTSGSMRPEDLAAAAAELTAIFHEARPERIDVAYTDWEVQGTESFSPEDEAVTLHAQGGGGTRFQPTFDHFNQMDAPPVAVVYFSDLMGPMPDEPPPYPVLWITPEYTAAVAPFGETVRLTLDR